MYLAVILIDYISPDGVLTTYRITPSDDHGSVVIDRLRDIDIEFDSPDSINVGGARVYNASTCSIQIQQTKLRKFRVNESETAIHLDCRDSTYAVSNLLDYRIISPKARKALSEDIADKSEWLELKPNIAGVGINLNAIIRDSIKAFQHRIREKDKAS